MFLSDDFDDLAHMAIGLDVGKIRNPVNVEWDALYTPLIRIID
jgi:hypothetical protein